MPLAEQRKIIAEKLFELANIAAGVIIFTELVGRGDIRKALIVFGLALFGILYAAAYFLLTKTK